MCYSLSGHLLIDVLAVPKCSYLQIKPLEKYTCCCVDMFVPLLKILVTFIECVCVCVCVCERERLCVHECNALRGQKRASDPMELELHA